MINSLLLEVIKDEHVIIIFDKLNKYILDQSAFQTLIGSL